jgi:hypothetical protein
VILGLCAALVNPLLFAAAWLACALVIGSHGVSFERMVVGAFLLLVFPLLASVAASALHRFVFPNERNPALVLLAGAAAMCLELHSEPFLKVVLTGAHGGDRLFAMVLAFLTDGTLIVALPVACVMLMVLLFEVPMRIVARAGGRVELGTVAPLVRFVLSFWVLLAGASLVSDSIAARCTTLFARVLS